MTNKGGQCLTNEAAMNLLEAEAAAKRQKLIDSEIKKRDREEIRKKELEEKEQNRVLKALKKANLNRKRDCGLKYEEEIKCNKSRWLSCFKCGIWCCFDCLPESFQVNKISNLYFCGSCSQNNEN